MMGDAAEQTVFDPFSGSHAMGFAAIMQGYSAICCEMNNDQYSWGKQRCHIILRKALDAKQNLEFAVPIKHMLVHPDDVNKDVYDMRFLPREELLQSGDHLVDGVDLSCYRKKLAPLRVSIKFNLSHVQRAFILFFVSSIRVKMLQGGVDGNHENVHLWYYKAKQGFVETSNQRKITEWMTLKDAEKPLKRGVKVKHIPDDDGSGAPAEGGGGGGEGAPGGGEGAPGGGEGEPDATGDASVEAGGDAATSLRAVPGFNDYTVDSWHVSDVGILSVTLRGKTITPPVLSLRYLTLPQLLFLDTPRPKTQLKLKRTACASCRVITGSSSKTVAECVEEFEKNIDINSEWYNENTRVLLLEASFKEQIVKDIVGTFLESYADNVRKATDYSYLNLCQVQFDKDVVKVERAVGMGFQVYEDHVEDLFPEVLKVEEQECNTTYFGEGDWANYTEIFFEAQRDLMTESLKNVDLQLKYCAKAYRDQLAVIDADAPWCVHSTLEIRAEQRNTA